jgi:hypothetical protein
MAALELPIPKTKKMGTERIRRMPEKTIAAAYIL